MSDDTRPPEWAIDLEVKLAYQERLIRDLDALVRELADSLSKTNRELATIKASIASPAVALGGANEPPPHY